MFLIYFSCFNTHLKLIPLIHLINRYLSFFEIFIIGAIRHPLLIAYRTLTMRERHKYLMDLYRRRIDTGPEPERPRSQFTNSWFDEHCQVNMITDKYQINLLISWFAGTTMSNFLHLVNVSAKNLAQLFFGLLSLTRTNILIF